jgi:hypothetical protein
MQNGPIFYEEQLYERSGEQRIVELGTRMHYGFCS